MVSCRHVQVETVLHQHPAVSEAAVVAMSDDKWGEVFSMCETICSCNLLVGALCLHIAQVNGGQLN
jgi:non-ribosomal peptide synthetase component E (peptide arylation enzyme)